MKRIIHSKKHPIFLATLNDLASVLRLDQKYLVRIIADANSCYKKVNLKKKDGGTREINAPYESLKGVQNSILYNYLNQIRLPLCVYGCGSGKSIIANAEAHAKSKYLVNLDIQGFFPSVHYKRIVQLFIDLGCSESVAKAMTKLTTLNYCLPQGSKTSPYLSSLVLENLDRRIMSLVKSNRAVYTRYFDDITISGSERIIDIQPTVENIIKAEGYRVKQSKKQIYGPDQEKKVTGILIKKNGKLDVENKEKLLDHLNNLKTFGISHLDSSIVEKEKQSLQGKIAFIASVDASFGQSLKNLFQEIDWP